jgi:hypothetical protein
MVDEMIRQMSKKSWYKWSIYLNIILFFIIGLFVYLLIKDSMEVGRNFGGDTWLLVARDVAFISISLALIFFQFFRNLFVIMRRSF